MIFYYRPVEMIEHKYRTKVTAVGLLKSAEMHSPDYIEPYYQRLLSYKIMIKDHTDNLKMAAQIAVKIFSDIILQVFKKNMSGGGDQDHRCLNYIITLLYPKYNNTPDSAFLSLREHFISKNNSMTEINKIALHMLKSYFTSPGHYDALAHKIVKKCLTGVTQEQVFNRIANAVYNFFVYGMYSRAEATDIYNITCKTKNSIIPMKYFTRVQSLARTVINKVGTYMTTVNFFGKIWDEYEEINALFRKTPNITVMYY